MGGGDTGRAGGYSLGVRVLICASHLAVLMAALSPGAVVASGQCLPTGCLSSRGGDLGEQISDGDMARAAALSRAEATFASALTAWQSEVAKAVRLGVDYHDELQEVEGHLDDVAVARSPCAFQHLDILDPGGVIENPSPESMLIRVGHDHRLPRREHREPSRQSRGRIVRRIRQDDDYSPCRSRPSSRAPTVARWCAATVRNITVAASCSPHCSSRGARPTRSKYQRRRPATTSS